MKEPGIINFEQKGNDKDGYLSIGSSFREVPFETKRVFWTYGTPDGITRGRHAHYETEMILIAVNGAIHISTITKEGKSFNFELDNPNKGLFLPKLCWHEMTYSPDAVQLVLASTFYDEADYIRSFEKFKSLINDTIT